MEIGCPADSAVWLVNNIFLKLSGIAFVREMAEGTSAFIMRPTLVAFYFVLGCVVVVGFFRFLGFILPLILKGLLSVLAFLIVCAKRLLDWCGNLGRPPAEAPSALDEPREENNRPRVVLPPKAEPSALPASEAVPQTQPPEVEVSVPAPDPEPVPAPKQEPEPPSAIPSEPVVVVPVSPTVVFIDAVVAPEAVRPSAVPDLSVPPKTEPGQSEVPKAAVNPPAPLIPKATEDAPPKAAPPPRTPAPPAPRPPDQPPVAPLPAPAREPLGPFEIHHAVEPSKMYPGANRVVLRVKGLLHEAKGVRVWVVCRLHDRTYGAPVVRAKTTQGVPSQPDRLEGYEVRYGNGWAEAQIIASIELTELKSYAAGATLLHLELEVHAGKRPFSDNMLLSRFFEFEATMPNEGHGRARQDVEDCLLAAVLLLRACARTPGGMQRVNSRQDKALAAAAKKLKSQILGSSPAKQVDVDELLRDLKDYKPRDLAQRPALKFASAQVRKVILEECEFLVSLRPSSEGDAMLAALCAMLGPMRS